MARQASGVPRERVRTVGGKPVAASGKYVLYWSTAFRRTRFHFGLEHAVARAREHAVPLVVLEGLRCDYPYASDRLHAFVIAGMADQARAYADAGVRYVPFVERKPREGRAVLAALAARAVCVVADDSPAFGLPYWLEAGAKRLPVRCEAVDANGLLPLRSTDRVFTTAASFRRHLQKVLPVHLTNFPKARPLGGVDASKRAVLPRDLERFGIVRDSELAEPEAMIAALPIDHAVRPVATPGGERAGRARWRAFAKDGLGSYADRRNDPAQPGTSGLSPYLHFGQIGTHEIFVDVAKAHGWGRELLGPVTGSREGWWGLPAGPEAFLDELVTWREIGLNMAWQRPDASDYATLPDWAQKTLAEHAHDPRQWTYTLEEFEGARTHDPLWNAAQRELVQEGRIHGYLRMLWGKKILEWSASPEAALATMFELNDRYALDGRDPNSVSSILWVLGRYDRAWGPERPIFGKIRYMSSESAARKLKLGPYLARYGDDAQATLF